MAALVSPRRSAASEAEEPVVVDYAAAPGCEGRDDFLRDVSRRATNARLGQPGEVARRFEVTIALADGAYAARLVVHELDGSRPFRSLLAPTCAQATTALALIVALSIDPQSPAPADPSPPDAVGSSPPPDARAPVPNPPSPPPPDDRARSSAGASLAVRPRGSHGPWRLSAAPTSKGFC